MRRRYFINAPRRPMPTRATTLIRGYRNGNGKWWSAGWVNYTFRFSSVSNWDNSDPNTIDGTFCRMDDQTASKSGPYRIYRFFPIDHVKIFSNVKFEQDVTSEFTALSVDYPYVKFEINSYANSMEGYESLIGCFNNLVSKGRIHSHNYTPSTDALSVAFTKMTNDASLLNQQDINIVAFIGELRDIRRLITLFQVKNLGEKDISSKYLGVQFGLLPFASDIAKIVKLIQQLPNAIKKWQSLAQSGRILNKHIVMHKINTAGSDDSIVSTVKGGYYNQCVCETHAVSTYTDEETVRAHIYFKAESLNVDMIDDLYKSIFGTNRVLGASWQLLPWSFIVDWFINVGELIDRFEQQDPVLKVNIVDSGYSVKRKTTIKHEIYVIHKYRTQSKKHTLAINDYERTSFQRYPYVFSRTDSFGPLRWKFTPDLFKGSISAALLHQKYR